MQVRHYGNSTLDRLKTKARNSGLVSNLITSLDVVKSRQSTTNNIIELDDKFVVPVSQLSADKEHRRNVKGVAGLDYPNFTRIPETSFTYNRFEPIMYADPQTRC